MVFNVVNYKVLLCIYCIARSAVFLQFSYTASGKTGLFPFHLLLLKKYLLVWSPPFIDMQWVAKHNQSPDWQVQHDPMQPIEQANHIPQSCTATLVQWSTTCCST